MLKRYGSGARAVGRGAVVVLLGAMLSAASGLHAQEAPPVSPIAADRPGLGDAAHVLPEGVWQAELGVAYLGSSDPRISVGQGLLRGGFGAFELRIYGNSLVLDQTQGSSDFGFEDLGLGAKVQLGAPGGWRWAAVGLVTLPTGSDAYSAGGTTGAASVVGETSLGSSSALYLNTGYAFPFEAMGEGRFSVILTPAFAVPGAPELTAYAGIASYVGHGDDSNFIEAGLAYARDVDTQLDLNWGVETDTKDWFLGVGWSHRWR